MDFLHNFQKKFSSYDKKSRFAKCFNKMQRNAVTPPASQQIVPADDFGDPVVMVERPSPVVRLVLFKELGDCDRPILFDSKSFEKNESCGAEKYRYVRSPPDWKVLSEMLFGSVGMAQKAASLKIHLIRSHNGTSIMLSRVFCLSPRESATASLDRGIENSFEMHRAISISSRRKANTMPVPLPPPTTPSQSLASSLSSQSGEVFKRCDSGISLSSASSMASGSYHTAPPSSHNGSLSSLAMKISSPHGRAHSLPKNKRDSFTVLDELTPNERIVKRTRTKIGFAVICKPEPTNATEFERFFFEHFPILESHMTALKENIEKAFQLRQKYNFIELMMKALDEFSSKLHALYSSQRLPEPVWSTMTSSELLPNHRRLVVDSFVSDLSRLVSDYNSKQRNFFVSSLLTAVLTYHLGWVASVSPSHTKNEEDREKEYNALWAQLGDLYGAVGSPTRVCRTVVTGSCHEIVSTFLSVLSYFIRSSRVDDVIPVPSQITPVSLGIQEPPPPLRVSIDMIPCDLDESEDYVCISLLEDDEKNDESESSITSSNTSSPARNPVLRTKSSPHKKPEQEEEEEVSSLTRSYSGPMIRGNRPRSRAFLGKRLSDRERTYSNTFLNKQKVVQSRRRSHEASDVTKPCMNELRHSFTKTSNDDLTKSFPTWDTTSSFSTQHNEEWINNHTDEELWKKTDETDDFNKFEIRKVQSFVDIVQPPIHRLINVQRACPEVVKSDRPTNLFLPEKNTGFAVKEQNISDVSPADDSALLSHDENTIGTKSPSSCEKLEAWKNSSRTKVGRRRQKLSQLTPNNESDKLNFKKDSGTFNRPMHFPTIPKYSRIPSVEMNHNEFIHYFDDSKTTDFLPATTELNQEPDAGRTTHHVISCPNFESLQFGSSSSTAKSSTEVESIYPKLSFNESNDNSVTTDDYSAKKLYPTLPIGSVAFHSSSEKISFNSQNATKDLPSPVTVLPPRPSPSRFNSVQSTRTVTLTDEFCVNEQLKELPLSDIQFSPDTVSNNDSQKAKTPNGFTSLMADYGQEYMSDFVLHGTPNHQDTHKKILKDLAHGCKNSTLDEPVAESVCILADTDSWSVKVYRSHRLHEDPPCLPALNSKLVFNILNRIAAMARMKVSPEFCMTQLESELRQLVLKSHVLAEYTLGRKRVTMSQLSAALHIESRDLPLLMSIASCHSPHVARMML